MFFNIYDILLVLPAMLISFYAQYKVQSTFKRNLELRGERGFTGADVARRMLDENGLMDVEVQPVEGFLSDHYDPSKKVVNLSNEVFYGNSVASLGVAAHEVGHAVQHSKNYLPLSLRASLVPIANFGSWLAMPLILLGVFIKASGLILFGVIAFSLAVAFQIVTLPVEFNASRRALATLSSNGFISEREYGPTKKVLSAAALTYVAAAAVAIAQLLSMILSLLGTSGEDT
ncbi:MAG: zinc metallopeptidase [Deltaproteobacteria bacterium]